jgi:hypothetical protein
MRNISEVISQHGRVLGQSKSSPSARALNSQISNQPHQRHPFLHAERNDEGPSQLRALFMFSCMFLTASPPNKIIPDVHVQWQASLACAARRLEPTFEIRSRYITTAAHSQDPRASSPCCLCTLRFVLRRECYK